MVLSWTCLIFWSPLIKNWLFFLSISRYIFGSFFQMVLLFLIPWVWNLVVYPLSFSWDEGFLCVFVVTVHELHRNFWRCSVYWGEFTSWWHFAPTIPHFPNVATVNTVGLFACLPLGAVVAMFSYSYHVLFLHMLQSCDFSVKHILSCHL